MSLQHSRDNCVELIQEIARLTLGLDVAITHQGMLQQTAEELWQVIRATVQAADEPALLP